MDIFDFLSLIGGLCLFLFGMDIMGQALERRAGNRLSYLLGKLTTNKAAGLLTGLIVTAVIQSSSATTVMIVGFVNSGIMTLKQSINVIMGANIGTTVTSWILSLAGIEGNHILVNLLKPSSFTPILALIGILLYMGKDAKRKDTGMILLGFATLMFGMDAMSASVSQLRDVPQFQQLFILFQNPVLGVLAGALLTAIIQSSSASVGILQALAMSGQVTYGAAIPIIMGQNIGTCVTAMLSAIGANKNAKRAAAVHLSFNVIGTVVWLTIFWLLKALLHPLLLDQSASLFGIAVAHSVFNILCTMLMVPLSGFLEKLVITLIPDSDKLEVQTKLDERLLATPAIALERCRDIANDMAVVSVTALKESITCLSAYSTRLADAVREKEEMGDHYEDMLGTYLVKLSAYQINEDDSQESVKLLKSIGDFERISDHATGLLTAAEEMRSKKIVFSQTALAELTGITAAVNEILDLTLTAFLNNDLQAAYQIEPLEQVIDRLKEQLRTKHIKRLQHGECTIDAGFIWSDILTDLGRTSDHCSNIGGCVIDATRHQMNIHEALRDMKNDSEEFQQAYQRYADKYSL